MKLFSAFDGIENMLSSGRRLTISDSEMEPLLAKVGVQ
jgi:hypothetical protein